MKFSINSVEELKAVVDELSRISKNNSVICFYGNLGAGKTTLIKLLCEQLEVIDTISSPTYPIINEYKTKDNKIVYHIDLYRLKSTDEAMNIGIEDYLFSEYLCLIEWPDEFETLIPDRHYKVFIRKLEDETRDIEIVSFSI